MGQIEDLVECWIESNKLPFEYKGVKSITQKLQSYVDVCDTLPVADKIKALSFLYDKCDYIINSIASAMNYQLEYEPTDDEVWNFIRKEEKQIDVCSNDFPNYAYITGSGDIDFDESILYEYVIEPMMEQYRKENKDAAEWCDNIQDLQNDIYIKISKEKEKQVFLEEVFSSDNKIIKTSFSDLLTEACPDKTMIVSKLKAMLYGEKGRAVAITLFALNRLDYINIDKLKVTDIFRIMQSEFGITGRRNTLDHAIKAIQDNENDAKNINAINKDMKILR